MQPDQDKLARARDKQLLRRQSATTRGTPSASPRITPCHFHTNPSGGSPESKENLQLGCILYLNRSGSEMAQISKQRFSPCYAKHNTSKMFPSCPLVSLEKVNNLKRRKSLKYAFVIPGDVVDSNKCNTNKPQQKNWSKKKTPPLLYQSAAC
jgi:hypothetical protein